MVVYNMLLMMVVTMVEEVEEVKRELSYFTPVYTEQLGEEDTLTEGFTVSS